MDRDRATDWHRSHGSACCQNEARCLVEWTGRSRVEPDRLAYRGIGTD